MLKKTCTIALDLDTPERPFYTAGDAVSGLVTLDVLTKIKVSDVQIKLKCEEWSAVAIDVKHRQQRLAKRQQKSARRTEKYGGVAQASALAYAERRPRAQTEYKRHFSLVANIAPIGEKFDLDRGTHSYSFNIVLPDRINNCPPHCPINTRNELKVGTRWTLKIVVHRPGAFQGNVREVIDLPVYPTPTISKTIDLSRSTELSGALDVREKTTWLDTLKGTVPPSTAQLVARLKYPAVGLPQLKVIPLSLSLEATGGHVQVASVRLYLVQNCVATTRLSSDTYRNMYPLMASNFTRTLLGATDLSELMDHVEMKEVYAPNFVSKYITVSYFLHLEVDCKIANSSKPGVLSAEASIEVLPPALCVPLAKDSSPPLRQPTAATIQADDDADEDDDDNDVNVDDQARHVDAAGFHAHDTSRPAEPLPTYDDAVPDLGTRVIDEDTFQELKQRQA